MYETSRIVLVVACATAFAWSSAGQPVKQTTSAPPEQPVSFSHKLHAGKLKQECSLCHTSPHSGETMGIAAVSTCAECHSATSAASPALQKLAALVKEKREPRWARVYEIPSYVRFSHRAHLAAGGTCVKCHGPVAEREQLYRETDISMGACMKCHSDNKASVDCTFCHEPQ
jgi:Cytochrome c7 and related cytochrome c